MKTTAPNYVTIVTPSGNMSSALRSYLSTLPGLVVEQFSSYHPGNLIELCQYPADCFVLDVDAFQQQDADPTNLKETIIFLHTTYPNSAVALVVNSHEQKFELVNLGAELVLLKGFLEEPLMQFFSTSGSPEETNSCQKHTCETTRSQNYFPRPL